MGTAHQRYAASNMKLLTVTEGAANAIALTLRNMNGHSCTCSGCVEEEERAKAIADALDRAVSDAEDASSEEAKE